jgi:hypothetical protein
MAADDPREQRRLQSANHSSSEGAAASRSARVPVDSMGNGPASRGPDGLHGVGIEKPRGDVDLIAVSADGVREVLVGAQEGNDFLLARTEFGAEMDEVAARKRTNPAPVSAQGLTQARNDAVFRRVAREDGPSQY